jgi:hypothetical protein
MMVISDNDEIYLKDGWGVVDGDILGILDVWGGGVYMKFLLIENI